MEQVIERIGRKFEGDGLPRSAGRILGLLLMTDGGLSLDDLAQALELSKTSASSNARLLQRLGVVEPVTVPGDRRDYYRITPDLHVRLWQSRLEQLRETRDLMNLARKHQPDGPVGQRLEAFESFFARAADGLEAAGRSWFEARGHEQPAPREAGTWSHG